MLFWLLCSFCTILEVLRNIDKENYFDSLIISEATKTKLRIEMTAGCQANIQHMPNSIDIMHWTAWKNFRFNAIPNQLKLNEFNCNGQIASPLKLLFETWRKIKIDCYSEGIKFLEKLRQNFSREGFPFRIFDWNILWNFRRSRSFVSKTYRKKFTSCGKLSLPMNSICSRIMLCCQFCGNLFKTQRFLNNHQQNIIKTAIFFQCGKCAAQFTQSCNLFRHLSLQTFTDVFSALYFLLWKSHSMITS